MKLADLYKELKKATVRPAYLLAGAEPLLRDDALAAIRAAVLGGTADDWNLDRLPGEKTTPGALQDAVRALPVMAERRLVILTEPERRRGAAATALTDAIGDVVRALADQQETVLVVVAPKADRRSRWVKAFADPSARVECDAPTQRRSLAPFIKGEAKQQGVAIDDGAVELLCDRIGPQLLVLRQEIAKLGLLVGDGETVTSRHVADSSTSVAEQPVWDLTDAIGTGQSANAIEILARVQASGAAAPMILGVLAGHFRKLAYAKAGASVPGPPFVVRKLEQQSRRYTLRGLRHCLDRIHQTDTALKGMGSLPPQMALEDLVLELGGMAAQTRA